MYKVDEQFERVELEKNSTRQLMFVVTAEGTCMDSMVVDWLWQPRRAMVAGTQPEGRGHA